MPANAGGEVEADVGDATQPWAAAGAPALLRAVNRRATHVSLGCVARSVGGARALPLGALLEGDVVESGAAVPLADRGARFPRSAAAIAASAPALFAGTSYQWGGVTPGGADCSGFVQMVYRLHGVELPRDAWQQALVGVPAPARIADLAPADLLFFSDRDDRRITHVAVALGGSRMAHIALGRGGFAVEQLDDASDEYVARLVRQQVGARRVVG
jgi:cell wall-associated NlpC family hydrolase